MKRISESGNVLFLILIAVALFAALSYAVTRSNRSGNLNPDKEINAANAAALIQYPPGVKSAIMHMIVSKNVDPGDLEFNVPSDFGTCSNGGRQCVFHPEGGGVGYAKPVQAVFDYSGSNPTNDDWIFTGHFEVENVSTSTTGNFAGNEIVALLYPLKKSVCDSINKELDLPTESVTGDMIKNIVGDATKNMDNNYILPSAEYILGPSNPDGGPSELLGEHNGCWLDDEGYYVFYSVLVDR